MRELSLSKILENAIKFINTVTFPKVIEYLIYKTRFVFPVILFFLASFYYGASPLTCKDGWESTSIGTKGACSHHGGVKKRTNDPYVVFFFGAIALAYFINSRYRTYGSYIVRSTLPSHNKEKNLGYIASYNNLPGTTSYSKKSWKCNRCHKKRE